MGDIVWVHRFLRRTKKERCPKCRHNTFVPYYNITTNQKLDGNTFGKCDREHNCGYWNRPTIADYKRLGLLDDKPPVIHPKVQQKIVEEEEDAYEEFPTKAFIQSISVDHSKISLFRYLCTLFPENKVREVFQRYCVGYDQRWKGSPIFWQIDAEGGIRTGKVMGYNDKTGKRNKKPHNQVSWIHSVDYKLRDEVDSSFCMRQCLFGEHLIDRYELFNIVESEKTALICTLYSDNPKELWLSNGGCENIKNSLFRCLEGRPARFFPDKGKSNKWSDKIMALDEDIRKYFTINTSLEKQTDLPLESDMADYIINKLTNKQ